MPKKVNPKSQVAGRSEGGSTSSLTTKRSEFISYVNPNINRIQRAASGISIVSHFLQTRPSQTADAVESIKSVYPDKHSINIRTSELNLEVTKIRLRNSFVQKVFGILTLQFFTSLLLLCLVYYVSPIYELFHRNVIMIGSVSLCNYLVLSGALIVSTSLRKEFPGNLIMMILITVAFSVTVAAFPWYKKATVCPFYMVTLVVITMFTVTLASSQYRFDISSTIAIGWTAVFIVLVTSGAVILIIKNRSAEKYYVVGVVGIMLLFFTWWIMSATRRITADRKVNISAEDYIFGALSFYIQFLFVFVVIIELIKYCRRI